MISNSSESMPKALRIGAGLFAAVGGVLGAVGVGAALAGDKYLTDGTLVATAGVLTVIALIAAIVVWWRPILAAVALVFAIGGYWFVIAGAWGNFWSAYQTAVQTSGAAENQFWTSGVLAVPSLAVAIPLLTIGCLVAVFAHDWSPAIKSRAAAIS